MTPRPPVPTSDRLAEAVGSVPWFSRVGAAHADDGEVERIGTWEEVPSPEEPRCEELAQDTVRWYDALRDDPDDPVFRHWHDAVLAATRSVPGLRDDGDAWDPLTQCRWSAAWVAGLVALHLADDPHGASVPAGLADLWSWFAAGHFPCAYADLSMPRRLVVL